MAVAGFPFVRAKMLEIVGNNEIIKGTHLTKKTYQELADFLIKMYDSFLLSGSTIHHDMQPLQPRKGIERVVGLHECHFKGRCWFKIKMLER